MYGFIPPCWGVRPTAFFSFFDWLNIGHIGRRTLERMYIVDIIEVMERSQGIRPTNSGGTTTDITMTLDQSLK